MRIFVALNIVTAHWYRFYANTVIIFLKPFGLFRLPPHPHWARVLGGFSLISSYCVLQLVRDHPLLKCTYLYRCTTTGLTGFKNQPPEWFLLPENRSNDDSDGKRPHHPQKIVSRSCSSTTPDQRDNQLPTVAGV